MTKDDVVRELRDWETDQFAQTLGDSIREFMGKAATLIEQQAREIEERGKTITRYAKELNKLNELTTLKAENERLRKVLQWAMHSITDRRTWTEQDLEQSKEAKSLLKHE